MNKNLSENIALSRANFFVLRSPLYSFPCQLNHNVDLIEIFDNRYFKEALFLSSTQLYDQLQKLIQGEILEEKEKEKIKLALLRYYLRMSYRCTPFGLFAGISVGQFRQSTCLEFKPLDSYKKFTRLDMDFLCALALGIAALPTVKQEIKYFPNDTIYIIRDQIRYVEYRFNEKVRSHHLVNIENSIYIEKVLLAAKSGAYLPNLIASILDDEIEHEDAQDFVIEMIDNQLLLSELEPTVTGNDYANCIKEVLAKYDVTKGILNRLANVFLNIKSFDTNGVGMNVSKYQYLIQEIESLNIKFNPSHLFQVDLIKPLAQNTLNVNVLNEIKKALTFLANLNGFKENNNLKKFRDSFYERYDQQEIALVEVLDSEIGIGYPIDAIATDNNPLIANVFFGSSDDDVKSYSVTAWHKYLFKKYADAITAGIHEIIFEDDEIKSVVTTKDVRLPPSFYSLFSIMAGSQTELDNDKFELLHLASGGSSAVNLLGRFGFADEELLGLLKDVINEEEGRYIDVVFAEIVHISQARLGNILSRPSLREYEIPIITRVGVDDDHVIPLQDLFISVSGSRIILRSKRLNKEVIPRLTTAHNYLMNALPHYQFLCDLQVQNAALGFTWDWGILSEFDFLPRVKYGKTVLCKARWTITHQNFKFDLKDCEDTLDEKLTAFIERNKVPDLVTLSDGDNQLLLFLNNKDCRKILIREIKKRTVLKIEECLFNEKNLIINGPEGKFTNEIIVPFRSLNSDTEYSRSQMVDYVTERRFIPGSEWFFVKLYCGVKTADKILLEVINSLADSLLKEGIITKWFFIRYADPKNHLRIRFQGKENFFDEVMRRLTSQLRDYNNLIDKITIDTYEREMERYGEYNIENSENFFFYDSVASLKLLNLLEGDEGDEFRWLLAIKGVDSLLDDFHFNLNEKIEYAQRLSESFSKEFNVNKGVKHQLADKFRKNKDKIAGIINEDHLDEPGLSEAFAIIKRRSTYMQPIINKIVLLNEGRKLRGSLQDLAISYIHMFLNRFLRSNHRMQELVIYDLLHQYYKSISARIKQVHA